MCTMLLLPSRHNVHGVLVWGYYSETLLRQPFFKIEFCSTPPPTPFLSCAWHMYLILCACPHPSVIKATQPVTWPHKTTAHTRLNPWRWNVAAHAAVITLKEEKKHHGAFLSTYGVNTALYKWILSWHQLFATKNRWHRVWWYSCLVSL